MMEFLGVAAPTLLGFVGFLILAVSLIAAFFVNSADSRRKWKKSEISAKSKVIVADTQQDNRERCTILYGTQTGTAERFAKSLRSQLESSYGATTTFDVVDLEHYDGARLAKEKLVFFLMATYGDGEPTDNAAEFYNWLIAEADAATEDAPLCKDVKFGIFALGNRQYEHFCAVGKKVHAAMQELGATSIVRVGTGDDDVDIDEDFDAWSADLFAALQSGNVLRAGEAVALTAASVPAYEVDEVVEAPLKIVDQLCDGPGLNHTAPHLATITTVRELHSAASDRSCIHVEVDISGCDALYEAGDHVGVCVENSPDVVAAAAAALGMSLSTCFKLRLPPGNAGSLPEPPKGPVTLRFALARLADLLSAPSKAALSALGAFASDPVEAARLAELASIEGRDAYHAHVSAAKRSLLEILQEFPSARPSLGAFFGSIAPRLQPRFYSISSAPALHPRSVHITCAVVEERMPTGRIHHGVASSWLAAARSGTKIPVFIRHSSFKLPKDSSTPVVMVGPGTGLAPFRGFIQQRAARAAAHDAPLGPGVLFFGCRTSKHDYIYQEELQRAVLSGGGLSSLNVAFSREGPKKDYVQHHMAKQAKDLWRMLGPEGKGYLYVCGDAKNMAKDVHRTLHQIVISACGCSAAAAEEAVKVMSDEGRYLKDVW